MILENIEKGVIMLSVSELKELIVASAGVSSALAAILEDGKINIGDFRNAGKLVKAARLFAGVDYTKALEESKNLDEAAQADLSQAFKDNFDIKADGIEAIIEEGFGMLLIVIDAIMSVVRLKVKI